MEDTALITEAREARLAIRRGEWTGSTAIRLPGWVQCNLVVLPRAQAYGFMVFCQRNPKACPLIEVTDPGDPEPRRCAPGADLRSDLPRYAVYRAGQCVEEPTDLRHLWRADSVAFLIGSSLTFDAPLERAGVSLEHGVWVLDTGLVTTPAGQFAGNLVVTMRLFSPAQAIIATQWTARFPSNHGAPVHVGDPALIGADLAHPLYGPPLSAIPEGAAAGLLGLRRDAPAGRAGRQARSHGHPQVRARLHHRSARGPDLPLLAQASAPTSPSASASSTSKTTKSKRPRRSHGGSRRRSERWGQSESAGCNLIAASGCCRERSRTDKWPRWWRGETCSWQSDSAGPVITTDQNPSGRRG
jgi:uncharacterized protein YcsI (UPF0317 family)